MPARVRAGWLVPLALMAALVVTGVGRRRPGSEPLQSAERLPAGDVMVRAVRFGSGDTTLVLLHGYGESLMSWRALSGQLAQRFRIVAVDLPGFGLSDKPAGPYDLEAMHRRLSDFISRHTDGPVVVVGHSMGGEIAAALALSEPRIVAAVLIAPAGLGLGSTADSLPPGIKGLAGAVAPLVLPVHDPAWLAESEDDLEYDPVLDPAYHASTRTVLQQFDFSAIGERFAGLDLPVLLIWGRHDPTIPFEIGEAISALLPCGTFVEMPDAFHRPHQAQPDLVAAEIEKFFNRSHAACES